jgi:hypothetical protein
MFDSRKLFFRFIFPDVTLFESLRLFQYTHPDFTPPIILQSKIRIPLVHIIEGNTGGQVEQRSYRIFNRIYFSKLICRLTIDTTEYL